MFWLLTSVALTIAGPTATMPVVAPIPIVAQVNVPKGGSGTSTPAPAGQPGEAAPGGEGQAPPQQSPWPTLIIFGVIFLIFWLFIIRPQSKKAKEHTEMVKSLKKGDEVVTQSGIFGRISGFDDAAGAVVLEVAQNTRIKVVRSQVGGLQQTNATEEKSSS